MYLNWFEIEVSDFEKSKEFYERVFNIKIEKHIFNGQIHGFLNLEKEPRGVLVENKQKDFSNKVIVFFHVFSLSDVLMHTEEQGGKVLIPKTLLKTETNGNLIISESLIDNKTGYFAKISDLDGNIIGLHSYG